MDFFYDVGSPSIALAAGRAGLDAEELLAATHDPTVHLGRRASRVSPAPAVSGRAVRGDDRIPA